MSHQIKDQFITAMRRVAGTVAIVTTGGDAGVHGATVSSFCSVSADPASLLVCLHDQSRIANLVSQNQCFCINVLPQDSQFIADRFAGRHDGEIQNRFEGIMCDVNEAASQSSCPAISDAMSFQCRLVSNTLSGSHRICVGEVFAIHGKIDSPLTYMEGDYRRLMQEHVNVDEINGE